MCEQFLELSTVICSNSGSSSHDRGSTETAAKRDGCVVLHSALAA